MTTPVFDFVRKYAESGAIRMHMPGHKGKQSIGCEQYDLTEIAGADELYAPTGIIAESEANASKIFGCDTYYSTEGSSLCIRAMLYLAMRYAADRGQKPVIAAARNAHKTFLTAAAMLDFDIIWLPHDRTNYLKVTDGFSACLDSSEQPAALYLTSPDYLGNLADLQAAAAFCHEHDMLLLVDNAHGAYLKFLTESLHPIDLGADLCCDSAHKTLPVLTGGAYLHIADSVSEKLSKYAKSAMALFASTSPSYLILASLDCCNQYLEESFPADLQQVVSQIGGLRNVLTALGWTVTGNEPMKLTIKPKPFGCTGTKLAEILQKQHVYVEFADPDYLVLMPSPRNEQRDFDKLEAAFMRIPKQPEIPSKPPVMPVLQTVSSPREVLLLPTEKLPVEQCKGRICAEFAVSCPPAVPIVTAGERITDQAIACMQYYGIIQISVVK